MANKSGVSSQVISLPKGGGAIRGIGEKFASDLHTGTGSFSIPLTLPAGRNGFQPQLNLGYSTGSGNSAFGLGWNIDVPGINRQLTGKIPVYDNATDTFVLSGSEDLVPIEQSPTATLYRPRTEGLFARIAHRKDANNDFWEVRSKTGLVSLYGTPNAKGNDPATITNPAAPNYIFAWNLTKTTDLFGNRIDYFYTHDAIRTQDNHNWDQCYLSEIRYLDYGDAAAPQYLVKVKLGYAPRPDPFSSYRAGFEIRTVQRCKRVEVFTEPGIEILTRTYHLTYLDELTPTPAQPLPLNAASLLSQVHLEGHDADRSETLPPLKMNYSRFDPQDRTFFAISGPDLPAYSLANPRYELADLFGNGLPDMVEISGTVRYWRNLGDGKFDRPREMKEAPGGLRLEDAGVQLLDANGDGRVDLLVSQPTMGLAGYFPLQFGGFWDRRSFQPYRAAPGFNLEDPEVKLVDLDGDGVTDAIRSGSRFECYFNDPHTGWQSTRFVERQQLEKFPNLNFSDPHVKWGDIAGSGLQDILLVYDGKTEYWPNLGYGNWGAPIFMHNSPRFPYGYDPRRIMVGDVDGDGLADMVYVDDQKVLLWVNQFGNGWHGPIEIRGTPRVTDMDAVRLVDLLGTGVSGLLWSGDVTTLNAPSMYFLDFTGGNKPYLMDEIDNRTGATTKISYKPSTAFYLEDEKLPATRWKTSLPFPVQTVAQVSVFDAFSGGKLTTTFRYHHGHWDGGEREFRGFGRVDQFDTETFEDYNAPQPLSFEKITSKMFSPPTETRTWFHLGPVGEESGDWGELDLSSEFWAEDPPFLQRPRPVENLLDALPRRAKRDAIRALRGSLLRTELYARDGSDREDSPYTVTERVYGVREEAEVAGARANAAADGARIFFAFLLGERTGHWERGREPHTGFTFTGNLSVQDPAALFGYDRYGQPRFQTSIAVPRHRDFRTATLNNTAPYLATCVETLYVQRDESDFYMVDRVAATTSYEILNDGKATVLRLRDAVEDGLQPRRVTGQTLNFYDGPAFLGLPLGQPGDYGAVVRTLSLVFTTEILQKAYGNKVPPYLSAPAGWTPEYPPDFQSGTPPLAGYIRLEAGPGPGSPVVEGYFVATRRVSYDFHDPLAPVRGLVRVQRDTLGHDTVVEYDEPGHPYGLFPVRVTDPAGLVSRAGYDYRTLQPARTIDPNGNELEFQFTPLGMLSATFLKGNPAKPEGDRARPGLRTEYDYWAFDRSGHPIWARTVRQLYHDTETDVPLPLRDETVVSIEYSDGFGRLLQTRSQAEDFAFGDSAGGDSNLAADQNLPVQDAHAKAACPAPGERVTVSGWQLYDNKGQVVERFEPYFDCGWEYLPPAKTQLGQKTAMFYDPTGQLVKTQNPDGSEQFNVLGVPADLSNPQDYEPTPWETYSYDANDNAGRTHPTDPRTLSYQAHWDTPASLEVDALGRVVRSVVCNRASAGAGVKEYITRQTYDIQGNPLTTIDPLGRVVYQNVFDLAGRNLAIFRLDAGARRVVFDAAGNLLEQRDAKGALTLHTYDKSNRPLKQWSRDGEGQSVGLRELLIYGDSPGTGLTVAQAGDVNLLGKLYQHFDEAGLITVESYDFMGNPLEKLRRIIRDDQILNLFDGAAAANWQVQPYRVDWQPAPGTDLADRAATLLETVAYRTSTRFDALGRLKRLLYPQAVDGTRRELRPEYDRAGNLEHLSLDNQPYIQRSAYNARGQRLLVAYGNGIMTRYNYDSQTFRLARLRSERFTQPDELTFHPTGLPLQDFSYEYDLAGNLLFLHDRAPRSGVAGPGPGQDGLDRAFSYDPLYRLLSATGRECKNIPQPRPWDDGVYCGFGQSNHGTPTQDNAPLLTALYREEYAYDPVGNLLELRHTQLSGNGGSTWLRKFGMGGLSPADWQQQWQLHLNNTWADPTPPNRLTHVEQGNQGAVVPASQAYFYDANGNLIRENLSRFFEWDYADRLKSFRVQAGQSEPSIYAHYLYDSLGQRVKKLVRKQGGQTESAVYIDDIFEQRRLGGQSNNTLHLLDNGSRAASLRVGNPFGGDSAPALLYALSDHLGSSHLAIDDGGHWVNREEYLPYGETCFGSFAFKRYRFTGQERDEESGLYYQGARYYAPGLARWTSCDPVANFNGYWYANANPVNFSDTGGRDPEPSLNGTAPERQGHWETGEAGHTDADTGVRTLDESKFIPDPPSKPSESTALPYELPVSDPEALRAAEGRGHIERGDVGNFFKGLFNGFVSAAPDIAAVGLSAPVPAAAPLINQGLKQIPLPKLAIDPHHAGAGVMGEKLGYNLALEAAGAGVAKLAEVAETASVAKTPVPKTLGPKRRLPIVNPHFQPGITPHKAMEGLKNKVVARFEQNPRLVGNYLTEREQGALNNAQRLATLNDWQRLERAAPQNFGKAVERAMAKVGQDTGLFEHIGITRVNGRFAPSNDLRGLGPYAGLEFQVTTWGQLADHLLTHPEALYVLYDIPLTWYLFLIP